MRLEMVAKNVRVPIVSHHRTGCADSMEEERGEGGGR